MGRVNAILDEDALEQQNNSLLNLKLTDREVQGNANIQINPNVNFLLDYYRQFGQFPVQEIGIEGNLQLMDNLGITVGGRQLQTPGDDMYGGNIGLEYKPTKNQTWGATYNRQPVARYGNFGLRYRYDF